MRQPLAPHIEFKSVSPQYYKVLLLRSLMACVIVLAVPIVLIFLLDARPGGFVFYLLIGIAVLILALFGLIFAFARRRARAIGYALQEEELIVKKGIMFQALTVVPYGRMQTVNVRSGPLNNRYGLAEIELVTASVNSGASIPGIERAEAEELRARLTKLGTANLEGL